MGRGEGKPCLSVKSGCTMDWVILIMVILLQWNARSLLANGQEFKHFVNTLVEKPDIICVQETWLKPNLDFIIYGYLKVGGVLHLSNREFHIDNWVWEMKRNM